MERQLQAAREERDAKLRWRKEAMEQDRKIEMENCRNLEAPAARSAGLTCIAASEHLSFYHGTLTMNLKVPRARIGS